MFSKLCVKNSVHGGWGAAWWGLRGHTSPEHEPRWACNAPPGHGK